MTILVTGSSGFIASSVVERLLNEGHDIVGIDDHNDYYDPALKAYRNSQNFKKGLKFFEKSILDKEFLKSLFKQHNFEAVVHLGAMAGVRYSQLNPHLYFDVNVTGTLNILELNREFGVKKFILASTSSLYAGEPMPYVETRPVNFPLSPYAASKKSAEVLSYTYHYLYKMDVTITRFFTVYGPAGRPDMSVYRFIEGALEGESVELYGDGSQARDFTFVEDIAQGVCSSIGLKGFQVLNLGGGNNPITVTELIELVESITGKKLNVVKKPFMDSDMKVTWADISEANRWMNWKPNTSFIEGVQKSIDWHLNNRDFIKLLKNIRR